MKMPGLSQSGIDDTSIMESDLPLLSEWHSRIKSDELSLSPSTAAS